MRRFFTLFKKELKELMTLQMVLPLIISSMVFAFIGNVISSEQEKIMAPQHIYVLDFDASASSAMIISALESSNFKVEKINPVPASGEAAETDKAIDRAQDNDITFIAVISSGFEEGLKSFKRQEIKTYSIIKNFSLTASLGAEKAGAAINAINRHLGNTLISQYTGGLDPEVVKNPVISLDNTVIGGKSAGISPDDVTGYIMSQIFFIPIVMFIIIIFSSQMIGTSIASEKENKTLETLLSTPVSRLSLVLSKMAAAAVTALVMASVYMLGFSYYMKGLTGGALQAAGPAGTEGHSSQSAIAALGLTIDTDGYILLGISLFLSIITALAAAMILGAFAEDVKKVQGLLTPIIFMVMIPYIFSLFLDIPNASLPLKMLFYSIPFSHTFLAAPNLFLQNHAAIYAGLTYQLAVFILLAVIAARIFSTDRILTLKMKMKLHGKSNGHRQLS